VGSYTNTNKDEGEKKMARYLIIWSQNPMAPFPMDPEGSLALNEKMWAALDDLMKKGILSDFGFFLDGTSGYAIGEGTGEVVFKNVSMFLPFMKSEVHEIISYEKGKELGREVAKALIEAAKQ